MQTLLEAVCHLVAGQCNSRPHCIHIHIGIEFAYGHLGNDCLRGGFQTFGDFDVIQSNLIILTDMDISFP